jgi:hypothetical protein
VPVVGSVVSGPSRSIEDTSVRDVSSARTILQFVEILDGLRVGCPHPETFASHLEGG